MTYVTLLCRLPINCRYNFKDFDNITNGGLEALVS